MRIGTDALIEIRALQPADREHISQILVATNMFTDEEIRVAIELIDAALHDPQQQDYEIFTAVDEKREIVGYYCAGPTPLTQGTYDLYWIAVAPSVQGRGIGVQLSNHAEVRVRARGGRLLVAETSSQSKYDNTRAFYLKHGYLEVARIKEYYKPGDDLVIYGKYVS
ncbi:MAG TPA: GNAT family N-acetyltransferase [Bacteroidota bacterium]|jgi:ribosomal protein S18 acetylase RimI-like enzyme|nr:GNAT family N-acetyltransferase [Bacteroidota bacterium]